MLNIFKNKREEKHDHDAKIFNYDRINENIFIGNNMCCSAMLDEMLVKEGIYADISLEEKLADNPVGAKAFLWVPIVDHNGPTLENIKITNAFIRSVVDTNQKVYVHCKNGHGRAPTIVISYLMSTGMSYDDAYKLVKNKRPVIHLDIKQETFLKSLEQ